MNRLTLLLLLTALVLSCTKNTSPTIDGLFADPDSVYPGDTIYLTCGASDVDGDPITFIWSYHGNNIGGPIWIAPKRIGQHYILVTVTDGIYRVTDSIGVTVLDTMVTFTDARDSHQYKWVKIGKQVWMAENLAYLPQVSSSATKSKTEPIYYVYDFDNQDVVGAKNNHYYQEYGVLYNWEAAKISCPEGWHLPTTTEWMTLCKNVDSNLKMDAFRLKSLTGWVQNGNGDNSSGFNTLPASFLGGGFGGAGGVAYFWTITSTSINNEPRTAECWRFDSWFTNTSSSLEWRDMGFSIRCVKDE